MDARAIGLILLWLGTALLVMVLLHRLRRGAWSEQAFEAPPAIGRWLAVLAVAGMALAASGAGLTVWSLW